MNSSIIRAMIFVNRFWSARNNNEGKIRLESVTEIILLHSMIGQRKLEFSARSLKGELSTSANWTPRDKYLLASLDMISLETSDWLSYAVVDRFDG